MKKVANRVMLGVFLIGEIGMTGYSFPENVFEKKLGTDTPSLQRERVPEREIPICFMVVTKKADEFSIRRGDEKFETLKLPNGSQEICHTYEKPVTTHVTLFNSEQLQIIDFGNREIQIKSGEKGIEIRGEKKENVLYGELPPSPERASPNAEIIPQEDPQNDPQYEQDDQIETPGTGEESGTGDIEPDDPRENESEIETGVDVIPDEEEISAEEILDQLDDQMLKPQMITTSGNITINIPGYDPAVGRGVGTTQAKEATVTVNFGTGGTDKRIRIKLAEGFKLVTYPVLTIEYSDREVVATSELATVLSGVTSKPQRQTYYPTYNSGYLEYQLISSATKVEIKRLSFTADEIVTYGNKMLMGAVTVASLTDGVITNETSMNVNIKGSNPYALWIYNYTADQLSGNTFYSTYVRVLPDTKDNYKYYKSIKVYYYYPKEMTFNGAFLDGNSVDYTLDAGSGLVTMTTQNKYGHQIFTMKLSALNVAPGKYTAGAPIKTEIETYDGTIITINQQYIYSVTILDPKSIPNKLRLTSYDRTYQSSLGDDYFIQGPSFYIDNTDPVPKTNQVMEYAIGTGYEVIQVSFTTTNNQPPAKYEWETRSGLKGIATKNQIFKTNFYGITQGYGISITSLGLPVGESFKYAKAYLGTIDPYDAANKIHYYTYSTDHLIGRLLSGVNSATVTAAVWAENADGTIQTGTYISDKKSVYKAEKSTPVLYFNTEPLHSVTAGSKKTISFSITGGFFLYSPTLGFKDPVIYLREIPGIFIDETSIQVKKNGVNIPFAVTGYVTTKNQKVTAISIPAKVGYYFDGTKIENGINISYDILPTLDTVGIYPLHDYVSLTTKNANGYHGGYNAQGGVQITDAYDVNNDGIVDVVMRPSTVSLNILENKNLVIDTYIQPAGSSRQPPYDITRPETAVNFKLGTSADYEIIFNNQRTDTATILTYIPVPKAGNDFGTNFQSTGFKRNMKLGGAPTLKILNASGIDVTSTKKGNYTITYTTAATNQTNYTGVTYTSTYNPQATMIKIENATGMQPGEKATLTFNYIVDENETSVANHPEKLGAINDFRPYYYFQAGSATRTHGTRVGAILQIGRIGGTLFSDTNADGIYNGTDLPLPNKTVALYKKGVGDLYTLITSGQTAQNGSYLFTGLSNGNYRVDFSQAATPATPYFTIKGTDSNPNNNSRVEYTGTYKGSALNIDPTTETAKNINAGILAYNPSDTTNGLKAQLNKTATTLTITTSGINPTEQLTTTVLPTFFNQIKDPTTPFQRISTDPNVVSVTGTQTGAVLEGKTYGTGIITFTIKDVYGNTAQTTINVTVQNKIKPTCSITYQPNTATNQNVVATLTGCNTSITIINTTFAPCQGNLSEVKGGLCTFTTNGGFIFEYKDVYGNTGSTPANVQWIDKINPIVKNITYNPNTPTNGKVTVLLEIDKIVTKPNGWSGSTTGNTFTKSFQNNTNETVTFTDLVGNTNSTGIKITWIDKIDPICGNRTYDPILPTSGNVTATLTGSTDGDSGIFVGGGSCTLTGNATTCDVQISDNAGNTRRCKSATVNNIDKTPPTCSVKYSTTQITNQPVVVSLTGCSEPITITNTTFTPCQGGLSEVKGGMCTLYANGTGTFLFVDVAGNLGSTPYVVTNIDTQSPFIALNGSGELTLEVHSIYTELGATVVDNDDPSIQNKLVISGTVNTGKVGTYYLYYNATDSAGNKAAEKIRTVIIKDTTAPVLTLNGSGEIIIQKTVPYKDEGASRSDNYDGTGIVYTNDLFDIEKEGIYTLTYVYVDTSGNTGNIVQRILRVINNRGGGGGLSRDYCPDGDFSPSYYDRECDPLLPTSPKQGGEKESDITTPKGDGHWAADIPSSQHNLQIAYKRAYDHKITSIPTFEQARITDAVTRAEMAKMIVVTSLHLFLKEGRGDFVDVDKSSRPVVPGDSSLTKGECTTFSDLHQAPKDLQPYIIKACELGLMGYYSDGKTIKPTFNVNNEMTRAEVGVILSRMLRGTTYAGTEQQRYQKHLQALHKNRIINFILDPMMKELRGNVFLMLRRIMDNT